MLIFAMLSYFMLGYVHAINECYDMLHYAVLCTVKLSHAKFSIC